MNYKKSPRLQLIGVMFSALLLFGCSRSNTIIIDAPDDISELLTEGSGDNFTYYAIKELAPEDWGDVSNGILWICNEDDHLKRPPLIPETAAKMLNESGLLPGGLIQLTWERSEGEHSSSDLGINDIVVTFGQTYEGCTNFALEQMAAKSPSLLLTDTDGMFDGKDRLVIVEFD